MLMNLNEPVTVHRTFFLGGSLATGLGLARTCRPATAREIHSHFLEPEDGIPHPIIMLIRLSEPTR
jgi:hypothetical protein